MNKGRHIDIMGIVNLTDDSYFEGSRCGNVDSALARASGMLGEGASIIDFGACSTRPGSLPVGEDEEWRRLAPVLKAVRESWPSVCISIDTCWSSVVERAFDLIGDFLVNDISAGEDDPCMLSVVGKLGLGYVAMHKRGTPEVMQSLTDYNNVTEEVLDYFHIFAKKASKYGICNWILDPGFGFSKDVEQNYKLLSQLGRFKELEDADGNVPRLLVGMSRKSMIYKFLGITPEEALPATQVVHLAALQSGADILRVHDVAEAARTVKLYKAIGGTYNFK